LFKAFFLSFFLPLFFANDVYTQVLGKVTVVHHSSLSAVTVEWISGPDNDMWADAVVAVVLQIESRPASIKRAFDRSANDVLWSTNMIF
jgi:hypothetical protein